MATALTLYVDTDVSGGLGDGSTKANAYSSVGLMISGAAQDLVANDKWLDARIYGTAGTAETSKITVSGWTTDATRDIQFSFPDYPKDGKWDTSTYRLEVVDDNALDIRVGFFRMSGMQIKTSKSATNAKCCVFIYEPPAAGADIRASSCIFWAAGQGYECWHSDGYATTVSLVESSILLGGGTDGYGWVHTTGTNTIRNCTVTGHDYYGINITANGATGFAYNCCVMNNYDDFAIAAGGTVDYCASDDGDGTNAIAASGGVWTNEFNDYANKDFTPKNSGNIYQGCGTRYVTLDFAGNTFDATTPTCGAFEYVAAGGDISLTVADIDFVLDVDYGEPALSVTASIVPADIDFALDMDYEAPALGVTASLVCADIDFTIDMDFDSVVLPVVASIVVADIDFTLDVDFDNATLIYNAAGDTNLIVQDINFALNMDFENAVLTPIGDTALIVQNIDFVLDMDFGNVVLTGVTNFVAEETVTLTITKDETITLTITKEETINL